MHRFVFSGSACGRGGFLGLILCVLAMVGGSALAAPAPLGGSIWTAQGSAPTRNIFNVAVPNGEADGCVQAVAAHPFTAGTLFLGAVNGGVWRTLNATSPNPTWTPLTDFQGSLSISAIEFDPTDATVNTLVAGVGRYSSLASEGGARTGILRTVDGGNTWTPLNGGGILNGVNISGVAPRGNVIVVSADAGNQRGIFRSTDAGATFVQISTGTGAGPSGLPAGIARTLAGSPPNLGVLYTGIYGTPVGGTNGIYTSSDTGATWSKVSNATMDALINNTTDNMKISAAGGALYVGIVTNGVLGGVFRSGDAGVTWTQMDLPTTTESTGPVGIHPSAQGAIHFGLVADPANTNLVFISGDRQPIDFPSFTNSIGATSFSGRSFRGDASRPAGSQWVHLTHSSSLGAPGGGTANNSAPHPDSRGMVFDAAGDIVQVDDGGIYRRTNPRSNTGVWVSINGTLQVGEFHDIAYDSVNHVLLAGAQDNGSPRQTAPNSPVWSDLSGGDGGAVAVDNTSFSGFSILYYSSQDLGGFTRGTYNSSGVEVSNVNVGLNGAFIPQFVTPLRLNALTPTRLVLGGVNGVFESFDQGDTLSLIGPGVFTGTGNSGSGMAYGGSAGGVPNSDVLYVAASSGVFVRTNAGGALARTPAPFPGGFALDVTFEPANWFNVFAINNNSVFQSADAGGSWTNITANLTGVGQLRCIRHGPNNMTSHVVVGTDLGVYVSSGPTFTNWSRAGTNLPNAPVFGLEYNQIDDVLVAGTLGRGAWLVPAASSQVFGSGGLLAPPIITSQPKSRTATQGSTVTFSVGITNNATQPVGFQWRLNGVEIFGAVGSVLTVTNVQTANAGLYSLRVINPVGTNITADAVLFVNAPPVVTTHPQSQSVTLGSNVTFTVSASGTGPFTYQWRRNGAPIDGATNADYTITGAQTNQAGSYDVLVAAGQFSVFSSNATLIVLPPFIISPQPLSQSVGVGSNVTFTASAAWIGALTGPFTFQWTFNGAALSGATSTSLSYTNLQLTNSGNYACVVGSSLGPLTSANALLTVFNPFTVSAPTFQLGGLFQLTATGDNGRAYRLESSTNFVTWLPVVTNRVSGGTATFTDSPAAGIALRFYRIVLLP